MKTLVAVILALGVGFAAAYVVVTNEKNAELQKLRQLQPQAAASTAPAPAEKVIQMAAPAAPAEESPSDILDDLINIKPSGSDRNTALRLVVFKLETLAQRGKAAVPAIRAFLGRDVDVDYSTQSDPNQNDPAQANATDNAANADTNSNANTNGGNNRRFGRGGNGGGFFGGNFRSERRARDIENLKTDWISPPSLRLGLIGTLKEIGGPESEQALADMLNSTGRGVEVAYLTVTLEEIAPGKYRDAALKAAKYLLMNPPPLDSPDRLDELAKSYLYGVLEFYHDASFALNAQQMLVGADGRLDQDAMDYLSTVLKDQSVSALYAALQNPALTNQFDKLSLGREILNYAGQNETANTMFKDTLNSTDINSMQKAFAVMQLAGGGFGPMASDMPTDPQVVSGRIALLNSVASQYANDPTLTAAISAATTALQNGQPIQRDDMRQIFRAGGGGFFGGGGAGNGGNQ
jgi:hypothetical protein